MIKNTVYFSKDDIEIMAVFILALIANGVNFDQRFGDTPETYYAIKLER